jgi:Helicase conserved C-terminal domain
MTLFKSNLTAAAHQAVVSAVPTIAAVPMVAGLGDDGVLAASKALSLATPVEVPGMARPFQAHQTAAYAYALDSIARWGGCLVGDDMGLGKTQVLQALVANAVKDGGYAIMVAPPVAIAGYKSDLAAAFPGLRMVHLHGRKPFLPEPADIYFLSDDPLTLKAWLTVTTHDKHNRAILSASTLATGAVMLTRDEIHRDKGSDGKPTTRAKIMLTVSAALRNQGTPIVGATGTILTNRPVEALLPLRIIAGDRIIEALTPGARGQIAFRFLFRYCKPVNNGFGYNYGGCDFARMPELHDYLRRTLYVRREKSDLGTALPHSGWQVVPIALNGVLNRYRRVEKDFLNLILEEEGPDAMWRKNRALAMTQMQAMWEEAGTAKTGATVEYVKNLTDQNRQVVLFYYHDASRDALAAGLAKQKITTTWIGGGQTKDARQQVIADFQGGKYQVVLAQIRAAGMAVTLTAAADAVFHQVPWSAGDLKQAADRILRVDDITKARAEAGGKVTWHVLQGCYEDGSPTFEAAMWSILERKAKVCDAVNAGRDITMPTESVMQAALSEWYGNAKR